jgi:hypothetical protein
MEFATASSSPMQNMSVMQNATIMIAFRDVAKTMALGTRLRGSLVSSTVGWVNIGMEIKFGGVTYSCGEHHRNY